LASDAIVSRLMAQSIFHPGYSIVCEEFLTHSWRNELYVREIASLGFAGKRMGGLQEEFHGAIILGVVRPADTGFLPFLNLPSSFVFEQDDRLILLARRYEDTEPPANWSQDIPQIEPRPAAHSQHARLRVLVLGWSH